MKPIRLMMRAFGPYKDEQVIDFRELGEHRLFAISGKTGAGKTTIFDGIAFALYGNGSGADREDTKSLRSQFADEKVHTAVELTFEAKGKTYRIFRQLAHKKTGNKSETGEKMAFFEIIAEGQEVPACKPKLTDIRLKVEEILGLSYDQFNQIVMLPQGEFRKLLTSDTKNKEKILRKVFKTERYEQMAQKLEDKKRLAEEEAKLARNMRDQYLEQIAGAIPQRDSLLFTRLAEHSNIFQILEALTEERVYYEAQVVQQEARYEQAQLAYKQTYEAFVAAKQQNDQLEQLAAKRQQLEQLLLQRPTYEAMQQEYVQATKAAKVMPLYEAWQRTALTLQNVEQQLANIVQQQQHSEQELQACKERYEEQQREEPVRVQLMNDMHELEKIKPLYEEIEQLEQRLPQLQQTVSKLERQQAEQRQQIAILKEQERQQQQAIAQLEQQVAKLPELMEERQQLKELTQLFNQLHSATQAKTNAIIVMEKAKGLAEERKAAYDDQQQKWLQHRAYELASELVPGEPCPVCGSCEHPSLQQVAETVDKAVLEQVRQAFEVARQAEAKAVAQYETAAQQHEQLAQQLKQQVDLAEREQYEERYVQLQQQVTHLTAQATVLQEQRAVVQNVQQQIVQAEQQIEQGRQAVEVARQHELQSRTILQGKQQLIPSHMETLAQVQEALREKQMHYMKLKKAYEQAEQAYQQIQLQVAKLAQTVTHLQQSKEQTEQELQQKQQVVQQALQTYAFATIEEVVQVSRAESVMEELQQAYQQYVQQVTVYEQTIAEQEQYLAGKVFIDLQQLQQQVNDLQQHVDEALLTVNAVKGCASNCAYYAAKLEQVAEEIDRLEAYSGQIVQLYKVLVGQNDEYISFERFIQMGYLEQITEAANMRLHSLSNGQFLLRCSDRKEGNRRQSGLSLDVYDSYTGLPRDVKSLSGGEKFNASLCLALGLADVIQSFEGNVRIDTMFIDEGFGTLDEESLMRAIDVLIELQKSGRMVGVISHVEELKAAMPAIIQIEKLKSGHSEAKVIVK